MPPLHHRVRGHCHNSTPLLLSAGGLGAPVVCSHTALHLSSRDAIALPQPAALVRSPPWSNHHGNAPTSPLPLRVSSISPLALCEHEPAQPRPLVRPDPLPRPIGVRVPWTPPRTFVPTTAVTIAAGWGWVISAPMAIPVAAHGANSSAPRARALARNIMAQSFVASAPPLNASCASSRVWQRGWAFRAPRGYSGVDPNTVLSWLVEADGQLQAFSAYFLRDLKLGQVQLDELYAVLRAVKGGDISEADAIEHLSRSPRWVWTAMDPESKSTTTRRAGGLRIPP
jgi:hypothetical protein